ncbi:MAG: hypothetical protein HY318_01050 [Armatimonadetes bacterium]|nr:hypothetical protein [Armatimonadota bacterium]
MRLVQLCLAVSVYALGRPLFAQNPVPNASFEEAGGWATPSEHHPEKVTFDRTTAFDGGASLKLDGRGGKYFIDSHCGGAGLRPGKTYSVRVAIRRTTTEGHVTFSVLEKGEGPGWRSTFSFGNKGSKGKDRWEYFSGTFKVPADTRERLLILYNVNSGGVVWFDDIEIVEIPEGADPFAWTCRRVKEAPKIDGQLEEWQSADQAVGFMVAGPAAVCPMKSNFETRVSLLYDDRNLYVGAMLKEPPGYKRHTVATGRDLAVYSDDELEVFLSPGLARNEYFHFCVNAAGALYDAYKAADRRDVGDVSWNSEAVVRTASVAGGWSVEMAVPLSNLRGLQPAEGAVCTVNFCRNLRAAASLTSWARLAPDRGFHTPEVFTKTVFSDKPDVKPTVISNYQWLRGEGLLTNPDFSQRDESGKPLFWEWKNNTLVQQLETGPYPSGARFALLIVAPELSVGRVELAYRTVPGETAVAVANVEPAGGGMKKASFVLAENAVSLTQFSLTCQDKHYPFSLQLSTAESRTFIHKQKALVGFYNENNQDVIPRDTAASFAIYPEAGIVRGLPLPFLFNSIQTFGETTGTTLAYRGKNRNYRLILDLPKGIEIYSVGLYTCTFAGPKARGPEPSLYGNDYHRFVVPYHCLSPHGQLPLYLTTSLPPGQKKPGYYYLEWDGGKQATEQFGVRVYEKPRVAALKRFTAGLYLHVREEANLQDGTILEDPNAPRILADLRGLGLNTILIGNVWQWRYEDLPRTVKLISQARQAGMEPALHVSGLSTFQPQTAKETAQAVTLDDKNDGSMCPSYRGPAYQNMIKIWGGLAKHGLYWIDNDFEDWNYREYTICFCSRCKERFRQWLQTNHPAVPCRDPSEFEMRPGDFRELHQAWFEFKSTLIEEWHKDLKEELARNMAASGVSIPGFPKVGITEACTHWDWKRMTESVLDYSSPMLYAYLDQYAEPSVESMGKRCLEYREQVKVDRKKFVVTLAPGERTGEAVQPDKSMLYQVLEVAGSGAAGFKIWYELVMNGGQFYWMSRALRMIQPVEDVLLDGEITEVRCDNPNARVRFFRHKQGTVLFAAEYGMEKAELKLSEMVSSPCVVMDLDTGKQIASIKPRNGSFRIVLDENRVGLFFIGTKAQWKEVNHRR